MLGPVERRLLGYDIQFETSVMAWPCDEPTDYVIDIDATVTHQPEEDADPVEVGSLSAHLIQLGRALDAGEPFEDVFDAHGEPLYDLYRKLFDRKKKWLRAAVQDSFEVIGLDILYLERIEIDAAHRGTGLGLVVISRCIDVWEPQQGLVVCRPYPMQFDKLRKDDEAWKNRIGVDAFVKDKDEASQKLCSYWGRLGFKPVPNTDYWALSTVSRRPSIADVLKPAAKMRQRMPAASSGTEAGPRSRSRKAR